MIRIIIVLLVLYIGGYAAARTIYLTAGADGAPGTVVYPQDLTILSTVFNPLGALDQELTGTLNRVASADAAPAASNAVPAENGEAPAASDS